MSLVGRTYLLTTRADPRCPHGVPARVTLEQPRRVRVLARADGWARGGPARNVLLLDEQTGELVVRPFRGLRRP